MTDRTALWVLAVLSIFCAFFATGNLIQSSLRIESTEERLAYCQAAVDDFDEIGLTLAQDIGQRLDETVTRTPAQLKADRARDEAGCRG